MTRPTVLQHRRRARPRGYLLLESAIGGALLLAAASVAIAMVLQSRSRVSEGANRASAAALVRSKADEIASQTSCTASSTLANVGTDFPGFQWSWSAGSAASMGHSNPLLTTADAPLCEVSVTVEYPVSRGSMEDGTDGVDGNGRARLRQTKMWRP
jgi:hypothetical protein